MFKFKNVFLIVALVGCSSAQCRKPMQIVKQDGEAGANEKLLAGPGRVLVAKQDGSMTCQKADQNTSKTVEAMKADLKDIKVYDMAKQSDGLMHTQDCNRKTGNYNVYEIAEEDAAKALKLGFINWPLMKKGGSYDDR